ncbi:MAG: peptidyl-prolyl cis-trans isomerase [Thermoanaerobaculales bacterium]
MALKWLRDNLRHLKFILWGVVGVFVLLVFVDWGAGRSGGAGGTEAAIRIGDQKVSERQFLAEMQRLEKRFGQIYGERWNELRSQVDLAGQTASMLIDRELQLREADRVGITVSDEELREVILSDPSFKQENGEFVGAETYKRIIRAYFRMTPEEYEERYAQDLKIGKLNALMARGVWVSDEETVEAFRRQRELADFDLIQLRYESRLDQVSISEEEARASYAASAEEFRRDEERVIRYLTVEVSRLRRQLPVDTAELQAYYDEHVDDFVESAQAHARHILIRVAPSATEDQRAEAKLRADAVAKLAASGADFSELAAKHSDDPGTKDNGGDLGWFARGRMVEEFSDAVFSAKPGELVGPVKSQFGYHIIKVEGFRPEHRRPFEEVEEQVRFRVLEGRASAEAEARATALARRLESERPETIEAWQAIADEDEAVVLNQSPPFAAGQVVPGTDEGSGLADEAFAAEVGDIVGPRPVPRGWIVWQLEEVRPAGVPPFEDVRTEVEQRVRRDKAMDLVVEEGRILAERWRQGEDAEVLAEEFGSTVTEANDHRHGAPIGTIGVLSAVDQAVFSAEEGAVLEPIRVGARGVVVSRVDRLTLIDAEELEREMESVRASLMAERADRLLRSILNERRRDTPITVNNELMQRFAPAQS